MRRRQRQPAAPRTAPQEFQHRPFRQLTGARASPRVETRQKPRAEPPAPPPELDADDLFRREMTGVRPLAASDRARVAPLPPAPAERPVTDPDAEALAELFDLVNGAAGFDLADSVEFVEGAVSGVDRRLLRRLRAGAFAYQSYLDLHGLSAAEARAAVDRFLRAAHQKGQRCVLIVHGRGLNSKDQIPVLKHRVTAWLAHGAWARLVLAFASARPCDGGVGALYVLLRRRRDAKRPLRVTHGAKW